MPHSSRKKRNSVAKRREVVDDDGWTRVTKGITSKLDSLHLSHEDAKIEAVPSKDCTVEKITAKYQDIEAVWLASDPCKSLMALLKDKVLAEDLQLDRCIMFGSGSFCGLVKGWIERHSVALCQLAVLKTIQRSIEQATDSRPTIYAQDPCYNYMDKDFLKSLDIETVDSPQGFELLGSKSLAYSAYSGTTVELQVLSQKPVVFLTSKLDWYWRNDHGQARTTRQMKEKEDSDTRDPAGLDAKHGRLESECEAFEAFLQAREQARLPDLDYNGQPFHNQYLYWRKGSEVAKE